MVLVRAANMNLLTTSLRGMVMLSLGKMLESEDRHGEVAGQAAAL
jgi:hypothetical protein